MPVSACFYWSGRSDSNTRPPQLIPLDLNGLQSYAGEQKARLSKLTTLIADATARIEKVRKAAAPPPKGLTGAERQIIQDVTQRQLNSEILAIRRDADSAMIDIIRATQSAARAAKDMGERHWDIWSVLRRAKTGNGDVVGILEAMQLRAAYADILAAAGPVELAAWGQQAIDTGDAILADAVLRENGARKADERPFMGATLLTNLKNAEHIQAQALLNQIIDLNQQVGLAYSTFQRRDSVSFQRIQLGLKARRNIGDAVDESGAIIAADAYEGTPDLG